jgi:hypothetical protein
MRTGARINGLNWLLITEYGHGHFGATVSARGRFGARYVSALDYTNLHNTQIYFYKINIIIHFYRYCQKIYNFNKISICPV